MSYSKFEQKAIDIIKSFRDNYLEKNINNLEKFIKDETNLNVNIVENPAESVVRGLMGVVTNPEFSKIPYTPQDRTFE